MNHITTNCGCSPSAGSCAEHKAQNELASAVADTYSEADEVRDAAICACSHPEAGHNADGCMYPDPARPDAIAIAFCPCEVKA